MVGSAHQVKVTAISRQILRKGAKFAAEQSNLISTIAKQVGPSVVSVDITSQRTTNDGFFGLQTRSSRVQALALLLAIQAM